MNGYNYPDKEIWKLIPDFGGKYMISSHGRFKAIIGANKWGQYPQDRDLTPSKNRKQLYLNVTLLFEDESKTMKIHRLVATYFIPNPDNKPYVNHKDMNKHNNHFSNLEWVTPSENNQHALKNGAFDVFYTSVCKRNKFSEEQIRHGIELAFKYKKEGIKAFLVRAAKESGVSRGTLSKIIAGDRWPHICN